MSILGYSIDDLVCSVVLVYLPFSLQLIKPMTSLNPSAVFTTKLLASAVAGLTYLTGVIGSHYFQKSLIELRHTAAPS